MYLPRYRSVLRTTLYMSVVTVVLLTAAVEPADSRADSSTQRRSAAAAARRKQCKAKQQVRALVPLGIYVTSNAQQCIRSAAAAQKRGLAASVGAARARRVRRPKDLCQFVMVPETGLYFTRKETRCFNSAARAEKAGFVLFSTSSPPLSPTPGTAGTAQPTPKPTQSGTPHATTPTPTPAGAVTGQPTATNTPAADATLTPTPVPTTTETFPPSGPPISYSFALAPRDPADPVVGTYSGSCAGTLSADRRQLTLSCTHNVPSASRAHLQPAGPFAGFCDAVSATSSVGFDCALTAAQANQILAGSVIVDVHRTGDDPNIEVLDGFICPAGHVGFGCP